MNVIIQKSNTNLVKTDEEKLRDADLFLTKLGINEYNFEEEPLDENQLPSESEDPAAEQEALMKQ